VNASVAFWCRMKAPMAKFANFHANKKTLI